MGRVAALALVGVALAVAPPAADATTTLSGRTGRLDARQAAVRAAAEWGSGTTFDIGSCDRRTRRWIYCLVTYSVPTPDGTGELDLDVIDVKVRRSGEVVVVDTDPCDRIRVTTVGR